MKNQDRILQNALIKYNVLDANDLSLYVKEQVQTGDSLQDYLLKNSLVTEKQILVVWSQTFNVETIDFKDVAVPQNLIEKVPVKFVWYYKFMPVVIKEGVLTIATATPYDVKAQDEIRMHLEMDIYVVLTTHNGLNEAIKKYYGLAANTIDQILKKSDKIVAPSSQGYDQWIEDIERKTDDPTVSHLVNQVILDAYTKRATDIHIEPYRSKVRFRYRIDGVLVDANLPEDARHFLPAILSRFKILANLSITEKRLPQDGSAVVKTKEQNLDLRISTMPTPRGESMVIRILPTKVMLFSLEKLGFDPTGVEDFRQLIKKPHGVLFITGPTGSGKTTTLYACLNEINSAEQKIITIEDPVEYEMEGVTQVQVNPKVDFTFSTGLRSLLRHDPDILMVGEVRDAETAEIAIRTALTGHLVFSTLHTNDAASGISRLIDMGIEPYLIASSVEAFIAQRLVRIICLQCKQEDHDVPFALRQEMATSLKVSDPLSLKIYHGGGCEHCNHTGFYNRMAIYEILKVDDAVRSAILEKPRANYIKRIAMRAGMSTLRQNGWKAVANGVTTPAEIVNIAVKDEVILSASDLSPQFSVSQPQ